MISFPEQDVLAVDLGGTKVVVALVSPCGEIKDCVKEATCQDGGSSGVQQILRLIKTVCEKSNRSVSEFCGVGIGLPAVLEPGTDYVIWGPNLNGWKELDAVSLLKQSLGIPVFLEYDGHTAVLGEWWQGAGRGCASLVDIIIGTGVGGGIILNNELVRGRNRLAGAAGWFALTDSAEIWGEEYRKIGHWEHLVAGPGIAARARLALGDYPVSKLQNMENFTAREVFELADTDPLAGKVVLETARLIGLGLANIVSLLNPERIIIGGSVGQHQGERMIPEIKKVITDWAQPISGKDMDIRASHLGSTAGLLGAAYSVYKRMSEYS